MDITIKYPSHNDLVQWYYQLAKNISEAAGVTPEEVNALIAAYIEENPYPVVPEGIITQANAAENVVTSVNGEKGDVTVTGGGDVPENVVTTDNIAQNAVTSFNGSKGDVTGVTSVNGQTGAVTVPAVPSNVLTADNIAQNAVTSFNGAKGDVTGVTSVNGKAGGAVNLTTTGDGQVSIAIGGGYYFTTAYVTMTYGTAGGAFYAGIFPKGSFTTCSILVGAAFTEDPNPFVPTCVLLDTSEGVWTITVNGRNYGGTPTDGSKKRVCVSMVVA